MKLVIIFGAGAVGKMTVAQELSKITGLKLFHNHMAIEPVIDLFGDFNLNAILQIRDAVFQNFVYTENYGLIHTFMYDFDSDFAKQYINDLTYLYQSNGADVYWVELDASQKTRLLRNETQNRLLCKPSKRNIEESRNRIIKEDSNGRFVSRKDEITFDNFIRINNENLSAKDCALIIKEIFKL